MLDRVPEVALLIADYLILEDLSHLSLVNRALHILCRPRLFKHVKLVVGDPWTRDPKELDTQYSRMEDNIDSLNAASPGCLKLVKRLTVVGSNWTASEQGRTKLGSLMKKVKLEEIAFLHQGGKAVEVMALLFEPLWQILAAQTPSKLAVLGRPRPQQAWGVLIHPGVFPISSMSLRSLTSALPNNLSSVTFSGIELVVEDDSILPSSFFRTLTSLELVELYCQTLFKVAESFQAFAADRSNAVLLRRLSLDLFSERETSSASKWKITPDDLLEVLTAFGSAPLLSLSVGSTGASADGAASLFAIATPSGIPFLPAGPCYGASEVKQLVDVISSTFGALRSLALRINPRSEGWYENLTKEDMIELVISLNQLTSLRRFTTNALLPTDAAVATTATKQDDLVPLLEFTARFYLAQVPSLEAISLVNLLEVPHEAFYTSKRDDEEEKVRRTWRLAARQKEGGEVEMLEVI
ncbi:hypothetical protein JCM11251_003603 [Rhodosporidiobolus azoricus]